MSSAAPVPPSSLTPVPYRPICEVCGEEDQLMAAEIRKNQLLRGGGTPMAVLMPLRPLNMCDRCRETLASMLRDLVELSTAVGGSISEHRRNLHAIVKAVTDDG